MLKRLLFFLVGSIGHSPLDLYYAYEVDCLQRRAQLAGMPAYLLEEARQNLAREPLDQIGQVRILRIVLSEWCRKQGESA